MSECESESESESEIRGRGRGRGKRGSWDGRGQASEEARKEGRRGI